ncbi:MAG: DNRLRE domain-containing protein [Chloroflexi bacterium]|nr:DNRLRE domain-containing protein [Chloroflexota bacterium]
MNNSANDNAQWGIFAAAGTINGGGNNALSNGFAGQCVGVPCNVPPPNTLTGSNVTVVVTASVSSASLTFDTVNSAGLTTLTVDETPPALPNGYLQLGSAFYDVDTTAVFAGPIVVCLTYTPGSLPEPVQLLHYEGSAWTDVTTFNDPLGGQVCGQVSSLSPFAVTAIAPPETTIQSGPANPSTATTASFVFVADKPDATFHCSLDGAPFAACVSPASYPNLALGAHEFQVRATDGNGLVEPVPASYIWTILPPVDCGAPVVFAVSTDAWIDQNSASTNKGTDSIVKVQAKSPTDNNRVLVRFNLPTSLPPGCQIQTATLRMFAPSATNGRTLQALRLTGPWTENGVTWSNQPGTTGAAATTSSGQGWREWDVAAQVTTMVETGLNYGFLIRDASEGGNGFEQQFHAKEKNENVPVLIITYVAGGNNGQDIIPPQTAINSGPAITTMDTGATFTFAANEPTIGFECSLNGAAFGECDSPAELTGLAVGNQTFAVRAVDLSGLVDPTPATYAWTVEPTPDTTSPQTNIEGGPAVSTINSSAVFLFSADEPGSTFECSLDGAAFTACAPPREYTGLALGTHIFTVRATDAAANTDPTPASTTWTIQSPPETTIGSGPEATTIETGATFTFSADTPGSTFACDLDGAGFTACTSPITTTSLSLGTHVFTVQATDPDGHSELTPPSYTWVIQAPPDTTPPETTINSGPDATTLDTSAQFTFSANEPDTTFACALDSASFVACVSPASYTNLSQGAHTFEVRAIDLAGNVDATPASFSWTVEEPPPADTTPPETMINAGPEAATSETTAGFTFSANEAATFACSLNGVPLTTCDSPISYSGLAVGSHTFAVQAIDTAGNVDPTPASYNWVINEPPDTTPPHTTINSGPPASTSDTSATFTFAADEPGVTFECALDGVAFTACTTPATVNGLSVGEHTVTVRATDQAGNVDPVPASYTWTVLPPPDTTPPQTMIGSGPIATTPDTSAVFTFTANESGSTFECALDGGAFTACASPRTYTGLNAGSHTFAVRATDPAGNLDTTPATYSWTVSPPPDCGPQITVSAVADAWVDRGSTSNNNGRDSILKVQGKNSNSSMRGMVRFALPTNIPAGCVIESATLRLYAASWKNGRTLQVFRLNGSWTETGVTWNNQPATTGAAATTSSGSGWRQWDVATMVQTMLDTGVNNGFLIRDASETGSGAEQQFHAREKGNNIPVLVITLVPASSASAAPSSPMVNHTPDGNGIGGYLYSLAMFALRPTVMRFVSSF